MYNNLLMVLQIVYRALRANVHRKFLQKFLDF